MDKNEYLDNILCNCHFGILGLDQKMLDAVSTEEAIILISKHFNKRLFIIDSFEVDLILYESKCKLLHLYNGSHDDKKQTKDKHNCEHYKNISDIIEKKLTL